MALYKYLEDVGMIGYAFCKYFCNFSKAYTFENHLNTGEITKLPAATIFVHPDRIISTKIHVKGTVRLKASFFVDFHPFS